MVQTFPRFSKIGNSSPAGELGEGRQQSDNENRPRSDLVIVMALTPCFLAVCFVGYFLDDFPLYIYIYRYMI